MAENGTYESDDRTRARVKTEFMREQVVALPAWIVDASGGRADVRRSRNGPRKTDRAVSVGGKDVFSFYFADEWIHFYDLPAGVSDEIWDRVRAAASPGLVDRAKWPPARVKTEDELALVRASLLRLLGAPMRPLLHVVTLGVADLGRALAFYRDGLGFPCEGIVGSEFVDDETGANGAIALFRLENGVLLSLYPRADLAKDAGVPLSADHPGASSLGHAVAHRAEVDALVARAAAAGAKVLGSPRARPWGIYSGYFEDPDGHLWEIIWDRNAKPDPAPAP